jgi:hypothetical protein
MEAVISQLRELYNRADEGARKALQQQLRSLESEFDSEFDICLKATSGVGANTSVFIGRKLMENSRVSKQPSFKLA